MKNFGLTLMLLSTAASNVAAAPAQTDRRGQAQIDSRDDSIDWDEVIKDSAKRHNGGLTTRTNVTLSDFNVTTNGLNDTSLGAGTEDVSASGVLGALGSLVGYLPGSKKTGTTTPAKSSGGKVGGILGGVLGIAGLGAAYLGLSGSKSTTAAPAAAKRTAAPTLAPARIYAEPLITSTASAPFVTETIAI